MSHVLRACAAAAKANIAAAAFSHNFRYFVKYSSQNCLSLLLLLLQQVYYETNNKQQKKCGKKGDGKLAFTPCALSTKIDDSYFNVCMQQKCKMHTIGISGEAWVKASRQKALHLKTRRGWITCSDKQLFKRTINILTSFRYKLVLLLHSRF